MKKLYCLVLAAIMLVPACVVKLVEQRSLTDVLDDEVSVITPDFVLDAGHGGEDGGAVSPAGIRESDINLAVVLKMEDILSFCGSSPALLRREDKSLHDQGAVTLREKKVSDLKNRVAVLSAAPGSTLVSIHQNTYQNSKYRGAQVFYAPTDGSEVLAAHIQRAIRASLQPENIREHKQITEGVYLMNHIKNRAVLVECGFLTNPEEEKLLTQEGYQRKVAVALSSALLTADTDG